MERHFYTYIARCSDKSLYTGITNDLTAREKKHNKGTGSRYTRTRIPLKIIYSEIYSTRKEAAKREYQIKGWTKIKKENLIKYKTPNPKKGIKSKKSPYAYLT